jgi:5-methylcytosine-specific restriction endonuclease McrA
MQLWADSPGVDLWSDQEAADEHRRIYWPRPQGRWSDLTDEQRDTGEHQRLDGRICALEVDHKIPLWSIAHLPDEERRRFFGPENLWLLCPRDHKAKSKREAAERADIRCGGRRAA